MMKKMLFGVLAALGLFGAVFAFGGFGMNAGDAPLEDRASFMQAMHEGDYQGAKALSAQYGFGARMLANEEVFSLKQQMHEAMDAGDYEQAVLLKEQMREQELAWMQESGFEKGIGIGMYKQRMHENCPYLQEQ